MSTAAAKVTPITPPPASAVPSFYLRLARIQGEIDRISKTGVNKEQGYKFVEESAIMDAVKPMLLEAGIFMTMKQTPNSAKVEQLRHGKNDTQFFKAEVEVELCLIDGHSDAREVYPAHSYALDTGDKALQKALTSAGKYAVLKAFMISTGEDLDRDGHGLGNGKAELKTGSGDEPKATHKQIGFLQQLIAQNALSETDVREIMTHESGRELVRHTDMTINECSKVIECIKGQSYLAYLSRLKQPASAPVDDPVINDKQVQIIAEKFHKLGASHADIELNVSNYTQGATRELRQMHTADAKRLYDMLMRGEYVPAN